jgi:hypothetical protein
MSRDRQRDRDRLAADVAEFMKNGGTIQKLEPWEMSDCGQDDFNRRQTLRANRDFREYPDYGD